MNEKTGARWILLVVAVLGPVLSGFSWGKGGDIVPEAGKSVTVRKTPHGTVAAVTRGGCRIEVWVSTGNGVLTLKVKIWNKSSLPINVSPDSLRLDSEGVAVDPLTPAEYVNLTHEAKPYPVDGAGNVMDSSAFASGDATPPVDSYGGGMGGHGGGGGGRGGRGGGKGKGGGKGSQGPGTPEARKSATNDLLSLRHDPLTTGGVVPPGGTLEGRHVYQRNNLQLPLVVTFQPTGAHDPTTLRFIRSK